MRIIAEQDSSKQWTAWWEHSPNKLFQSALLFGAVSRLLMDSGYRHLDLSQLVTDHSLCSPKHIEMIVTAPLPQMQPGEASGGS